MSEFWIGVIVAIVTGALVNEMCDFSPWLARKMIPWAASTWALGDGEVAAVYAEEWSAVVDDCPGKLSKVFVALRFVAGAVIRAELRRSRSVLGRLGRILRLRPMSALVRYVSGRRVSPAEVNSYAKAVPQLVSEEVAVRRAGAVSLMRLSQAPSCVSIIELTLRSYLVEAEGEVDDAEQARLLRIALTRFLRERYRVGDE